MRRHKKKPHHNVYTCGTKKKYETFREAQSAADSSGRFHNKDYKPGKMGAYKCRKCKKFHFGHNTGGKDV